MKKILLLGLIFASNSTRADLSPNQKQQYTNIIYSVVHNYSDLVDALNTNNIPKAHSTLTKMLKNNFDLSQLPEKDKEQLILLAKKAWQRSLYKFEDRKDLVKQMFKLWLIFGILGSLSGTVAVGSGFSPLGFLAGMGAIGGFSASGISFGIGALNILPWYWARNEKSRAQKFVKLLHYSINNQIEAKR